MDNQRPPAHRQTPDRAAHREADAGESTHRSADLGHHIVARYGRSPGVIPIEPTMQRFRGTALFGHDRLPLLAHLSRHWGGVNQPFPGSSGPLTFLQPSPFASAELTVAERIDRPTENVTTKTEAPVAPVSVTATPRSPLPSVRETGKRMTIEGAITPSASVATKAGAAIVRRQRSQPLDPSPDPGNEPPVWHPAATGTEKATPVETKTRPADSPPLGSQPRSPTDSGLGRPIIHRRKHSSPEAPPGTTASLTTETGPPLRVGPQSRKEESTIRRKALPLPVTAERRPSTGISAPASPAPATGLVTPNHPSSTADAPRSELATWKETRLVTPDRPSGSADAPRSDLATWKETRLVTPNRPSGSVGSPRSESVTREEARLVTPDQPSGNVGSPRSELVTREETRLVTPDRPSGSVGSPRSELLTPEEPSSIEAAGTITSRSGLGTAIQLRHATTAIAKSSRPVPVSMVLPRENGPSRIDRSETNVGVLAETRPGTSKTNAPKTIAAPSAMAFPKTEPRAVTIRTPAEHPISEWSPVRRSQSAGRLATAMPGVESGSTGTLSPARAPMPLVVQREPQHFSAEHTPREQSPTAPWQAGNAGQSSPAIGGHRGPSGDGSGSSSVVRVEDLGGGTDVEPNPLQAGDGERPNVDELVDKVFRMLMRRLAVERERRGQQPWF